VNDDIINAPARRSRRALRANISGLTFLAPFAFAARDGPIGGDARLPTRSHTPSSPFGSVPRHQIQLPVGRGILLTPRPAMDRDSRVSAFSGNKPPVLALNRLDCRVVPGAVG
jgi:hypothetical protein